MATTVIRGTQILNNTVQRQDLDTATVGQAVVTKLVQGSGIALSSTGADAGTGDVTVSAISSDAGNQATAGSDNKVYVPNPIAVGTIWEWPGSTPPSGWLNCDGSAVSRTTYSALFGVIGTNFGAGDGSTTFNVPWIVAVVLGDNSVPGTIGNVTVYQSGARIIKF